MDVARGKSAASEVKNFKREIDRVWWEKDVVMSVIRVELVDVWWWVMLLEVLSMEVKRILGDALGEELGERDVATVVVRCVVDVMCDVKVWL